MEKPTMKQRFDSFATFLWNSETKQLLGRGGRSWGEIGLFYLIYYSCLAGFFSATLAVFYSMIDADFPRLQGTDSLLKGNPGMGFKPMPDIDTTLVRSISNPKYQAHIDAMTSDIDEALEAYSRDQEGAVECTETTTRDDADTACKVDFLALTAQCNHDNYYGMKNNTPCIMLKLNKIFGWKPEVWETAEEAAASNSLPESIVKNYTNDKIWVECTGENPADKDNIGLGSISYFPEQGFPLKYYPYRKQKGYLPPVVFVQFGNLDRSVGLMVKCTAYAKNIKVDETEKEGSVHFELLLDEQGDGA